MAAAIFKNAKMLYLSHLWTDFDEIWLLTSLVAVVRSHQAHTTHAVRNLTAISKQYVRIQQDRHSPAAPWKQIAVT
jgi:hypothetical protein